MALKRKQKPAQHAIIPTQDSFAQKSDKHLCWAALEMRSGSMALVAVTDTENRKPTETYEFFYRMHGPNGNTPTVFKAQASDPVTTDPTSKWTAGKARHGAWAVTHGAYLTQQMLNRLGCAIPLEIRDASEPENPQTNYDGLTQIHQTAGRKPKMAAASKTKGASVTAAWEALLMENEKAAKKNKKTDAQLIAAMEAEFPDKKGKSTLTRVSMIRGCYNQGTNLFASRYEGIKANDNNRPISRSYDENGDVIANPRSQGRAVKALKTGTPAGPAKKKIAKKTKPAPATKSTAAAKPKVKVKTKKKMTTKAKKA